MIQLLALLLYIGAVLLWFRALYAQPGERRTRPAAGLTAVAVGVHGVAVAGFVSTYGELPLVGLGPALSTLALIMGLALVFTLALGEVARLGIALLPVIVVVQGAALVLGIVPSGTPPDFQGLWFAAHVTLAFAGYGGAALAFAAGLLYLIQFKALKDRNLGRAFRFIPPLATLDRVGLISLAVGFTNLTLALIVGWAWTVQFRGSFLATDPKVLWAVFTWLVMGATIGFNAVGGRHEWRGAAASVVSFSVIVGSYVALRLTAGLGGGGLFP